MATAMVQLDEEALVREQIAQVELPKGVKLKRIEQGNDWMGEPSLTLYFVVSTSIPLTKKRLKEFSRFQAEVFERVIALKTGKWPYFRLLETK